MLINGERLMSEKEYADEEIEEPAGYLNDQ